MASMFTTVQLLTGCPKPLYYLMPTEWDSQSLIGKTIRVPLRHSVKIALVLAVHAHLPHDAHYAIRQALAIEPFPEDVLYQQFVHTIAGYYHIHPISLIARTQAFLRQADKVLLHKLVPGAYSNVQEIDVCDDENDINTLTDEQSIIYDFLSPHLAHSTYTPTVLKGVTGSGKTEIYKKLIIAAYQCGKASILLLPEVTIAREFAKIFHKDIGAIVPIYRLYSGISSQERHTLWDALLLQKPLLIIGVHLPIMLPISNLGLIIVDEEHDGGYQEKKHPKINTKEAAIIRAKIYNIPIVLGSATPSVSSLYNVHHRGWHLFELTKRFAGSFPQIKIELLTNVKPRKHFWISSTLYKAIQRCLETKEQAIIFINRRGVSFFIQCKNCTFIFSCFSCSVSLTLHEQDTLHCHYCGYQKKLPSLCTQCKSNDFIKKGIGTQQIVSILAKLFPHARIGRADLDVTSKKKLWEETITQFSNGTIDILVGTQSITKGFHFPRVTLVGIIWADLNVHFPHYTASEKALQQILQVAGRAGRQSEDSTVIVQTMRDHPIFAYLNEQNYMLFYEEEIKNRQMIGYPPHKRLVEIELKHKNNVLLEREAQSLTSMLIEYKNIKNFDIQILGPAKPVVHTIKKMHRRSIYLKATSINDLNQLGSAINYQQFKSSIFWTPNPLILIMFYLFFLGAA
jgi:primosomal protein N' (replication factor Y)